MYYQVAVFAPFWQTFDYLALNEGNLCPIGGRVRVPFGKSTRIGIVMGHQTETHYPPDKIKTIEAQLDSEPLIQGTLFRLLIWMQHYYHAPLGEVAALFYPKRLREGKPNALSSRQRQKQYLMPSSPPSQALVPNPEQHEAIYAIQAALGKPSIFLLEGVTGSGKTEVYLQAIQSVIEQGKQVLVLVPEIGLTPQTLARFQARFHCPLVSFHSGMTDAERFYAWHQAKLGVAKIVIGTRSASLIPLNNPGLFIIDEEHDLSFKQQQGLRYHARDVLMMRAHLEACPIVLGSATPSLESLYNAKQGRFIHLRLLKRAGKACLPRMECVDARQKSDLPGISFPLKQAIEKTLAGHQQVLLFLNQRGYAKLVFCHECGFKLPCPRCDAHLIFHQQRAVLRCHHCQHQSHLPQHCPECEAPALKPLGVGTEQVAEGLKKAFPEYPLIQIDRDTIQSRSQLDTALEHIQTQAPLIILGTQMIGKGHHFEAVHLVGILDVDAGFFSADFRSQERLGQLITQVSGRAGRKHQQGKVLLQTRFKEEPRLQTLLQKGYPVFADTLLQERDSLSLPPYTYPILLEAESKKPKQALSFLESLKHRLKQYDKAKDCAILGPTPALMEKRLGYHRAYLLLQSPVRTQVHELAQYLSNLIQNHPLQNRVRWRFNTDPQEWS